MLVQNAGAAQQRIYGVRKTQVLGFGKLRQTGLILAIRDSWQDL